MDAHFAAPYNEEITGSIFTVQGPQARESRSAARPEINAEFAKDRLLHEGELAEE